MNTSRGYFLVMMFLFIITVVERHHGGGVNELLYSVFFMIWFGVLYIGSIIKEGNK